MRLLWRVFRRLRRLWRAEPATTGVSIIANQIDLTHSNAPRIAHSYCWLLWILAVTFTTVASRSCQGVEAKIKVQINGRRVQVNSDDASPFSGVWLPTERAKLRGIQRASEGIAAGNFSQSLRFLDEVLGESEDSWIEADQGGTASGVKDAVRRMIHDLPPEGRAAYEAEYGPAAERMLRAAIAAGDEQSLLTIVGRYFYTHAGMEAALLLAQHEANLGNFLSAALIYQQLLDAPEAVRRFDPELSIRAALARLAAGDAEQAELILQKVGGGELEVGGRVRRIDGQSENPVAWLTQNVGAVTSRTKTHVQQWLTHRGNAARNAASDGGLPHMRIRWDQQLLDYGKLEQLFDDFSAELLRTDSLAPVANAPLAVGDYVIVRTPHNLLAVDFRTGKRVWETERQRVPEIEQLVRQTSTVSEEDADPGPARAFARRIWEDYLYGVIASDGERVYMVRDLPMPSTLEFDPWGAQFMRAGGDSTRLSNRLCAYDVRTQGKLLWQLDGADAEGLEGAFFLGAPLALGGTLYTLVEIKGSSVELVAINAQSGKLEWRQQLAHLEQGMTVNRRRRLQAAIPSFDSGILVCPTGAGVVVGVNLAKRSLAWAYQYQSIENPNTRRGRRRERPSSSQGDHWTDAAVLISAGRLLLTPPESEFLHCVDLHSGELLWKRKRDDMIRLACAADGRILVVGPRQITALRLADGKSAWDKPLILEDGVAPTGSGFLADDLYYLPLSSAEVVAIDLANGRITERTAARDGQVLGNLICHRGTVLSQNGRFLECFDQISVLRARAEQQLADDSENVEALRTLGEIAYNGGRLSEAIELLERAYRRDASDFRTRDVLAECLIAALDDDFRAHRGKLPLLDDLEGDAPQRQITLLRIKAEGFTFTDEPMAAADACLAIYEFAADTDELLTIGANRNVLASLWVAAQMKEILPLCSAEERSELERRIAALKPQHDRSVGDSDSEFDERLHVFNTYFGALPGAGSSRVEVARRLTASNQTLAAQQLWLHLARSDDESVRAEAVAQIAGGLHEAGLHRSALHFDRTLIGPLADVPCIDGKTGAECVRQWQPLALGESGWPVGKVATPTAATSAQTMARNVRTPKMEIRLDRTDPILGSGNVMLSSREHQIIVRDSYGKEIVSAPIAEAPLNRMPGRDASNVHAVSRGNLLIVSLGRQLAALNTLPSQEGLPSAVLWRANLTSNLEVSRTAREALDGGESRPGSYRAPRMTSEGRWLGVIGPVTANSCVFQDQRRLVCVDSLTGSTLWSRTDVPAGCDLFGDEEITMAVPKGERRAFFYSTVDGRSLGEAEVPPWNERLATLGRRIIQWTASRDGGMTLAALDPRAQTVDWQMDFARHSRVDIAQGRYVAVVEPSGRAVIVDAENGEILADHALPDAMGVREIHLAAGTDSFTLVTNRPQPSGRRRHVSPIHPFDFPVVDGQVAVFERATGRPRWSRPAEVMQQALMLAQPVDLPIIVFVSTLQHRDRSGSRSNVSLLILDKASGRTLYRSDKLPVSGGGHYVVSVTNEESREIVVEMASRMIELQFTEKPRPPAPPALAEVESTKGSPSGGLGRVLLKGFRGLE